ncbi:substrate-binding periplasmic protein [Alloyangia pacifica]|uniref:Polar amino acid transport system substrate-binding protein n=1 Tax=Alloyangia pacifica TaxID=311180 RepID=A0A1I6VH72_9RHOB|nr:transporter substrate-binding domain-containing protein [Alloyangia pacifica]SDH98065.1 polar amino acid transport system substrate-binding protein [Alloyangia pacifica]SFT13072.1 polar amino acid transport system substrate-binding protein [Alloyangia pacifica]
MHSIRKISLCLCLSLTPASLLAQEKITAASDVGFAPYSMKSMSGEFEGIDIDIAKRLSEISGIDIEVIQQPWSTTFAGLAAGKFDAMWSAATMTPERQEMMAFIEGYGEALDGLLMRASDDDIAGAEDLQGKTIAINKGSSADAWLTERQDEFGITIARFETSPDAVQAVISGQADGYMMYKTAAGFAAKKQPMLKVSSFAIRKGAPYGYAVRPEDLELRNKLDAAMECLKASGELDEIYVKWTGLQPEPGGITNTPQPGFGQPGTKFYEETDHEMACD